MREKPSCVPFPATRLGLLLDTACSLGLLVTACLRRSGLLLGAACLRSGLLLGAACLRSGLLRGPIKNGDPSRCHQPQRLAFKMQLGQPM